MTQWNERKVRVGKEELEVWEAGSGKPLLVFHDELGPTAWLGWHEAMAKHRRLVMPIIPGFRGPRMTWVRAMNDLVRFYGHALRKLDLGAVDAIGLSLGGWLAASMAVNNPKAFGKMVLVAPFGIKPSEGYIMDFFPMSSNDYIAASLHDPDATEEYKALYGAPSPEQFEVLEDARTECARLAWEPYMHDPALPPLLSTMDGPDTLILWGEDDAILPRSAVEAYARAIAGSELKTFAQCGHRPEAEQRDEFLAQLIGFLG